MNWDELLEKAKLGDKIEVTLINPIRKEEYYKKGEMIGMKPGVYGGGHFNYKRNKDGGPSVPHSFSSDRMHWIKKPKVLVQYNIFEYRSNKGMHSDWVNVDNCEFKIITQ